MTPIELVEKWAARRRSNRQISKLQLRVLAEMIQEAIDKAVKSAKRKTP